MTLQLSNSEQTHFLRRTALSTICLLLVAGFHGYRVFSFNQSRWKGGGFGMFSTVDSETARFVRVYIVNDVGQKIAVRLPETLSKRALVLRALPREDVAAELADRLLELEWFAADQQTRRLTSHLATVSANRPVTAEDLRLELAMPLPVNENDSPHAEWLPIPKGNQHLKGLRPQQVQIEVWQQRFDSHAAQLQAQLLLNVRRSQPKEGTP